MLGVPLRPFFALKVGRDDCLTAWGQAPNWSLRERSSKARWGHPKKTLHELGPPAGCLQTKTLELPLSFGNRKAFNLFNQWCSKNQA
jgi:hypothetical protein